MSGKIILPKKVACAIEVLRTKFHYDLYQLIGAAHDIGHEPDDYEDEDEVYSIATIEEYSQGNYEAIISAIVNGYEVEKSAEDKLLETYKDHEEMVSIYTGRNGKTLDLYEHQQERYSSGYIRGVKDFAKSYGIKIEGVNA